MGQIAHEHPPLLGHLLQLLHPLLHRLGQGVHVLGQVGQLVLAADVQPLVVVAPGDGAGVFPQGAQGAQQPPHQQQQQHGGQQADAQAQPHRPQGLEVQVPLEVAYRVGGHQAVLPGLQGQGHGAHQIPLPGGVARLELALGEAVIFGGGWDHPGGQLVPHRLFLLVQQHQTRQIVVGGLLLQGLDGGLPGLVLLEQHHTQPQPLVEDARFQNARHVLLLGDGPLLFPLPQGVPGGAQQQHRGQGSDGHHQGQGGEKDLLPQLHGSFSRRYPMRGRVTRRWDRSSFWRSRWTWMSTVRLSPWYS